jgi:hypothetical protein
MPSKAKPKAPKRPSIGAARLGPVAPAWIPASGLAKLRALLHGSSSIGSTNAGLH